MKKQEYSHHIRFYTPHHFIFYPIAIVAIVLSARFILVHPRLSLEWAAITIILILMTWLSYMMRQHYALTLQDRIVRLELRLRYYQLTQQRLESIEPQLSFSQL